MLKTCTSLEMKSTLAYWKFLVSVLLFAAICYFASVYGLSRPFTNDTSEQTTENNQQILGIIRQQYTPPLADNCHVIELYCYFEIRCEVIKCSSIPERFDPGEVAKFFIENVFKAQCDPVNAIKLIFQDSIFHKNILQEKWLKTNVSIDELTVINCFLTALSDTAFSSTIFEKTKSLSFLRNSISTLKRVFFQRLPNLENLSIIGNEIKQAEVNLLEDIKYSLQRLQLEDAIKDIQVLRNITGANVLSQVQVLSLRYNYIPIIDSQLFSGVPNVISLYLSNSHITTVCTYAFEPIFRYIKQLLINDNNITSLPKGLFGSILRQNPNFALTVNNNPWHCDCSLQWIQEMMIIHQNVIKKDLICSSPEKYTGVPLAFANFCDEAKLNTTTIGFVTYENDTTSTVTVTTSALSTIEYITEETMRVSCDILSNQVLYMNHPRRIFSLPNFEISLRFQDFSARELENGTILVTLPLLVDTFLIWFDNDARSNINNLNKSIRCVGKIKNSFLLQDMQPKTSYTICAFDTSSFSPLNCLGLTTKSSFESKFWLTNADESTVICVFVVSLLLMSFISAVLMFVIVRRHPAMLRGNKRIIIVKRRTVDAIVLPKGLSSDTMNLAQKNRVSTISRKFKEDGYVTPISLSQNPTRKSSTWSVQSDGTSYISGIEPSLSQLISLKLIGTKCLNWDIEPPPLPPHPRRNFAQSLSIVSDLKENELEDSIFTMQ